MNNYEYLKKVDLKKLVKIGIVSPHILRHIEYYEAYLYENEQGFGKTEIYFKLSDFFNVSERTIVRAITYMSRSCL